MKKSHSAEYAPSPFLQEKTQVHKATPDGYYELTLYPILPGILLSFNKIRTLTVPVADSSFFDSCFLVNYCCSGRCEFCVSEDNYGYVDDGLSSISAKMAKGEFYYPSAYYDGYEIYCFPPLFTPETTQILQLFEIDFALLQQKYPGSSAHTTPRELAMLWEELYHTQETSALGVVRLKTLQVLQYLAGHSTLPQSVNLYLTKTQSLLAKKLEEILTQDVSRHIAVHTVAQSLGVSETSLKNYFRSVYGSNVSDYLNTRRMKLAAQLLTESEESIAAVARRCGYVNQGRFAAVFYRFYHVKPMDYRRNHRLRNI